MHTNTFLFFDMNIKVYGIMQTEPADLFFFFFILMPTLSWVKPRTWTFHNAGLLMSINEK